MFGREKCRVSNCLPRKIQVYDVTLRDGFQHEERFIPTEAKLWVANALINAGVRHLEVGSFSHVKYVPQFKDILDVLKGLPQRDDVEYTALALNLKACTGLIELLRSFDREKKYIAAICAAPSILAELGMLKGRKACSYPSFEGKLDGADVVREPAVTDGHITTGRGMGTAIPFALRLTALLAGEAKAEEIKESVVYGG